MKHLTLLTASVAVCVMTVVAMVVTSLWYTKHSADDLRAEQIAGCLRANQQRLYINELIKKTGVDLEPIRIPVCEEIIK